MSVKRTNKEIAKDTACLAGEALLTPGVSLLAQGKGKLGLAHVGAGLAAKLALGPAGMLFVAANSYCLSKTGQSLFTQFTTKKGAGDQSLREDVSQALDKGQPIEQVIESVIEDVEDIYHEKKSS
ncbi:MULTISPECIES: DUF6072 family protein [Pseudoalteromonas]|uniref:Uncharacterized protein n=1 Tax=Pseudoalteromonas rubra TaxID=43658 RepID=A0A5S3UYT4_9GAMM|nr:MULTISPECIES: DUF6072 family protein [Pseudoalteromonas]MCG7560165.1 hypothetical protein [Pseudoalteromonas sp. McH1-42]MEC4088900.1 DUF6072 family protein [Pseudoalteromonas rubra]QPB85342.1 hypothetical protein CWC22_020165 [Pseudoalteromonas rubra]